MGSATETVPELAAERNGGEPDTAPTIAGPPPSGLDELREAREQITETEYHDLPIPGYRGKLVARYAHLEWEEIRKIRRQAIRAGRKNPAADTDTMAASDLIARACLGLFKRTEDGELTPLNELDRSLGDDPVRFDHRGAQALGVEAGSAREAIAAIFVHSPAIVLHSQELMLWIGQVDEELGEDFD